MGVHLKSIEIKSLDLNVCLYWSNNVDLPCSWFLSKGSQKSNVRLMITASLTA